MAEEHKVKLIMGDPSGDGHGKWGFITFKTNLPQPDIVKYYGDGAEIIGYDYTSDVAEDYEDNYLYGRHVLPLVKAGIDVGNIVDDYVAPPTRLVLVPREDWTEKDEEEYDYYENETAGCLYTDSHAEIFLQIARIGAEKAGIKFTWKQVRDDTPEIDIDGYGLFWQGPVLFFDIETGIH